MKRCIFFIALLLVVLGGLAWFVLRPHEPSYEGKRLTFWLDRFQSAIQMQAPAHYAEAIKAASAGAEERARAENAVRHIGTNAIPTLLRMLRAKNSPFTLKAAQWFGRQHIIKIPFVPAAVKNVEATFGFHILGAEAQGAVPALIKIIGENISASSRQNTAASLGYIGPEAKPAIPALLGRVADTRASPEERAEAIAALGQIHSEPETVIPVMLQGLKDTNFIVRWFAIQGIANFGSAARDAVPDLLQALKSSNQMISLYAADALKKIDPEAAAKAEVK